jgi:hypothetical protein
VHRGAQRREMRRTALAAALAAALLLRAAAAAAPLPRRQAPLRPAAAAAAEPPWLAPQGAGALALRLRRWLAGPPRAAGVAPRLPDGRRAAAAAELLLPRGDVAGARALADGPWWPFNSSEAVPLLPASLAWMADARLMAGAPARCCYFLLFFHLHHLPAQHLDLTRAARRPAERARRASLDPAAARALAALVAVAYCAPSRLAAWNCSRCAPPDAPGGFTIRKVVFDPRWDLLAYVGWSDALDAIVVAFRGTDSHSLGNWVENMRTWRTDLAPAFPGVPPRALVHGGFWTSYAASGLAGNVTAAVRSLAAERGAQRGGGGAGGGAGGGWGAAGGGGGSRRSGSRGGAGGGLHSDDALAAPTVFVAGHSLGGALAQLCALDLRLSARLPDVRLTTFGAPRVGNAVFARWLDAAVGPHARFTHARDVVPSVPPSWAGFAHAGREVWVVDAPGGRPLAGVCAAPGEDARCHASVCHFGLCSSLADHLWYLSAMFAPHPGGC